jgi:predicted esterase
MSRAAVRALLLAALAGARPSPAVPGAGAPGSLAPPAQLPRGELVTRVACAANPEQSYALYLPAGYRPDRSWPILYAFDARGRALVPAALFRSGAERFGYIVASSYNSASDGPLEPNLEAMRAMWNDTHSRLAIDDRRVYAAGFSGTVRSACVMAMLAPGTIAGIIGAGAGFPFDRPPARDTSFAFFGTVGSRDFNYYEMADLEAALTALGLPHRIEQFDGGHQWPPEALANLALGWMDLQAQKAGRMPAEPALVTASWRRDLEAARALAAADKLLPAFHAWSQLAADFAGIAATAAGEAERAEAAGQLSALQRSDRLRRALRQREERNRRDKEYVARAQKVLAGSVPGGGPGDVGKALTDLRIAELKRKAQAAADPEDRLSAQRLLSTVQVQTSFYLPQLFLSRQEYDRAIFSLSIAGEIAPDDPWVWYQLAAAHARKGNPKRALALLKRAVDTGWTDRAQLEGDPAFAPLRGEEGFRKLIAGLAAQPASPS